MPRITVDVARLAALTQALAPVRSHADRAANEILADYPNAGTPTVQHGLDRAMEAVADALRALGAEAAAQHGHLASYAAARADSDPSPQRSVGTGTSSAWRSS